MEIRIGALYESGGSCEFRVWAPLKERLSLCILEGGTTGGRGPIADARTPAGTTRAQPRAQPPDGRPPICRRMPMERDEQGYWSVRVSDTPPGTLYLYEIDGTVYRPDPASSQQSGGVHGPSAVTDHGSFGWGDGEWSGVALKDMIIYELHTGTFTPDGSFDAIIPRLPALRELGVNAIEIMPVAQFPGRRNWGYDGVFPFAVQDSYGGPEGLRRLVDACHGLGIAVVLDVVYNHIGPEGGCLQDFAPYFSDRYRTFWGKAVNFDDAYSSGVRNFFLQNALHWFRHYHIDVLRLDAVHAIFDMSAKHFLQELAETADRCSGETGRKRYLIAESDLNDVRIIRPRDRFGYGIHAQWCDDFHHALHSLLTGERSGYYQDFGTIEHVRETVRSGFYFSWKYSGYRKRYFGSSTRGMPGLRFVAFSQNHDQVGNRVDGRRLSSLVPFEAARLAAASVLLSPFIPLLFMGEEFAEERPFYYFVSHSDEKLIQAVRRGRLEEFQGFDLEGDFPDPQDERTFGASVLGWDEREKGRHGAMLKLYGGLIRLRRSLPALGNPDLDGVEVRRDGNASVLAYTRTFAENSVLCLMNFSGHRQLWRFEEPAADKPTAIWQKRFDAEDPSWGGNGAEAPSSTAPGGTVELSPWSFLVYERSVPAGCGGTSETDGDRISV